MKSFRGALTPSPPPPPTIIMLQGFLTTQLPVDLGKISWLLPYTSGANRNRVLGWYGLACENIRFSSLFAAGGVSRERSPAAKSEEKRMFSQARYEVRSYRKMLLHALQCGRLGARAGQETRKQSVLWDM